MLRGRAAWTGWPPDIPSTLNYSTVPQFLTCINRNVKLLDKEHTVPMRPSLVSGLSVFFKQYFTCWSKELWWPKIAMLNWSESKWVFMQIHKVYLRAWVFDSKKLTPQVSTSYLSPIEPCNYMEQIRTPEEPSSAPCFLLCCVTLGKLLKNPHWYFNTHEIFSPQISQGAVKSK